MLIRKQIATFLAFTVFVLLTNSKKQNETIYILLWTFTEGQKWMYHDLDNEKGQEPFIRRNCSFQNCYLTSNRTYLKSVLDFDVLVFNVVHFELGYMTEFLPDQRSESQLYVLFSVEPASYFSIPSMFDGIFNLTWTYLLKSDIVNPHFFVINNFSQILAPKVDAHWTDVQNMPAIDSTIVEKLQNKRIAALWVVSHCGPKRRWIFVQSLNKELSKYGHRVDTYGLCGDHRHCPKYAGERTGVLTSCYSKIESDYYFYLAFENSFTEDYVSSKVLHGLLHFSVPIVFGGANYARFLPNGIYLNALELGVEGLAREMNDIINDPHRYYDFFRWHNYYSIYDAGADDYRETVCAFCAFLNDKAKRKETQVYENITGWWNADPTDEFPNTPYSQRYTTPNASEVIEQNSEISVPSSSIVSKIIDFFLDFN